MLLQLILSKKPLRATLLSGKGFYDLLNARKGYHQRNYIASAYVEEEM